MILSEYFQWFKKEWAKVGVILSIYLLVFLFAFVRQYDFVVFVLLLQTPLYMLHQTEEYVFPGGFGKFFNTRIRVVVLAQLWVWAVATLFFVFCWCGPCGIGLEGSKTL